MRRVMLLATAIGVALLLASGAVLAAPIGISSNTRFRRLVAARSTSRGVRTGISRLPSPS